MNYEALKEAMDKNVNGFVNANTLCDAMVVGRNAMVLAIDDLKKSNLIKFVEGRLTERASNVVFIHRDIIPLLVFQAKQRGAGMDADDMINMAVALGWGKVEKKAYKGKLSSWAKDGKGWSGQDMATKLGGVSSREVNRALMAMGMLEKIDGKPVPTSFGSEFVKSVSGSYKTVRWTDSVIEKVKEHLASKGGSA